MEIKKKEIKDLKFNDKLIDQSKINYYEAFSFITFHVFIIEVEKEQVLEKTWDKLYNKIAFYMQDKFDNTFEKWNLYLFYLLDENCSISLKYEIENNPFSSRKIVIKNNKISHEEIISTYVFDTDIELNTREQIKLGDFKQESKIFSLIKKPEIELSVDGRTKDKSAAIIYEEILKTFDNEV